jgi:hypothetical protein
MDYNHRNNDKYNSSRLMYSGLTRNVGNVNYAELFERQYNYIHQTNTPFLKQQLVLGNLRNSMEDPNMPLSYYLYRK